MKLRFKVDQAEALRQGIDAPTSVVTIEIDPKTLTHEERNLLADRMDGIDVRDLTTWGGTRAPGHSEKHSTATQATFDALMVAVRANEDRVQAELRAVAIKEAYTAIRNSIAKVCPHLLEDATRSAQLIHLLLDEARTGQYCTKKLTALIGEAADRAALRFEFRNAISPHWKNWAMAISAITNSDSGVNTGETRRFEIP